MRAAFFDLDKTLVAGSSPVAFANSLRKEGILSRRTIARLGVAHAKFKFRSGPDESMQLARLGLELAKGWNQKEARQAVEKNMSTVIDPILFPAAAKLLADHKANSDLVIIVSSSPEDVVIPVADHLGVEHVIATRPTLDSAGCYSGDIEFFSYGEGKVTAMKEFASMHDVDLNDSFAYTDSVTDLPMLNAVGHPVVVNPDDELRGKAAANGWQVMEFHL